MSAYNSELGRAQDRREFRTGLLKVLTLNITANARRRCHHVVLNRRSAVYWRRPLGAQQTTEAFTAACLMEKPPKKPPQHRPQPNAQHYGQDPRLKRRVAHNLIGVDSLCLHLAGVGTLSP